MSQPKTNQPKTLVFEIRFLQLPEMEMYREGIRTPENRLRPLARTLNQNFET